MEAKKEPKNFEVAMSELEQIVKQLEQGELPLEEALAAFKRGIELSQFAQKTLTNAEATVAQMMTDIGEVPLDKEV